MDKPRWLITWILACTATAWTFHDSFWWAVGKASLAAFCALIIENYRSKTQNGDW